MTAHRVPAVVVVLAGLAVFPAMARAQADPSADDIIKSLTPGAGMTSGTRGIRPVGANAAPAESYPRTTAAHAAAAAPGVASTSLTVEFATGSAALTPAALRTLSNIGRALSSRQMASFRFRIEGHTDTVGSPALNKALSAERAQAVVAYVVGHYNVDPKRLDAAGMGEDGLLVQTPPQTPEPRNRRVDIINLGS